MADVTMPAYTRGLNVETSRDIDRHMMIVEVSLRLAREVSVSEEVWARAGGSVFQSAVEGAVRQMQDEAVQTLGLQHWRTEVEREVREAERRTRRELLRALAAAVRNAPTTDRAALLILDELEVMDQ